jgi:GLPGLI family protein
MADGTEDDDNEMTWTYSKETKQILDYKCKKAIATDADGNEIAYWYTEKIKPAHTDDKSALAQLPGLAMEYVVDREGMIMTFTASKLKTSLDSATKKEKFKFEIPEGYTEMTYDEFTSMGM